jgi:hypothetical protein
VATRKQGWGLWGVLNREKGDGFRGRAGERKNIIEEQILKMIFWKIRS